MAEADQIIGQPGPDVTVGPAAELPSDTDLRPLCALWVEKFRLAADFKERKFGKASRACWQFVDGPHDFLYKRRGQDDPARGLEFVPPPDADGGPTFQMTFNVAAELRDLFGPMMYHRNPVRTVTARDQWMPPDEMVTGETPGMPLEQGMAQAKLQYEQQKAQARTLTRAKCDLLSRLLNYTPNEFGLREQMRLVIDEALIGGMGTAWVEARTVPMSDRVVVTSTHDTVDNFLMDPDSRRLEDAKWVARRVVRPAWEVEREFGLPEGSLKSRAGRSTGAAAAASALPQSEPGQTADLVVYFRVWSKMGLGARLKKSAGGVPLDDSAKMTELFGDYVYFVVSPDVPFPLNVPWPLMEQALKTRDQVLLAQCANYFQWPLAFWADPSTGWPVATLDFHPQPKNPYPMPHLTPALGEMAALDWTYSFMMSHVRNACKTLVAVNGAASEDMKQAIEGGRDMAMVEVNPALGKSIQEMVQFLTSPALNADITNFPATIKGNFDRRTGLAEMLYGQTSTQSRSAQDASAKSSAMQIRPDDMANRVEDFASRLARMEALACRLVMTGKDVAPILGDFAAQFWDQHLAVPRDPVTGQPIGDALVTACAEYDYRVEAGSARKPNKDREVANADQAAQFMMPVLQQIAAQFGDWRPLNNFLRDWARARDLDPESYLVDVGLVQQIQQMQMQAQQQQPQATPQGVPNETPPDQPQGGPPGGGPPQGGGQPAG